MFERNETCMTKIMIIIKKNDNDRVIIVNKKFHDTYAKLILHLLGLHDKWKIIIEIFNDQSFCWYRFCSWYKSIGAFPLRCDSIYHSVMKGDFCLEEVDKSGVILLFGNCENVIVNNRAIGRYVICIDDTYFAVWIRRDQGSLTFDPFI